MKKALVAYLSCTGTTEGVARKLAGVTGGDLYKIEPAVPYTAADLDWQDSESRSSLEMKDKTSRPAIAGSLPDLSQYDVAFLGFPIWWYVAPTIINTFLESIGANELAGKTIAPFATSGSSGVGETDKYLHESLKADVNVKWMPAVRFDEKVSEAELKSWADKVMI